MVKKISTTNMRESERQKIKRQFVLEAKTMKELRSGPSHSVCMHDLAHTCVSDSRHPRIVIIYGVYTKDSSYLGLVLEFCRDGDLRRLLDSNTSLSNEQKLQILMDIAQVNESTPRCPCATHYI